MSSSRARFLTLGVGDGAAGLLTRREAVTGSFVASGERFFGGEYEFPELVLEVRDRYVFEIRGETIGACRFGSDSIAEVVRPLSPLLDSDGLGLVVDLTCVCNGISESESESTIFSADFTLGVSFAFFGGGILDCVEVTASFGIVFGGDSFGGTFVDFFLAALIMPPPTLRTGFMASSSADRFAGMEGVTG